MVFGRRKGFHFSVEERERIWGVGWRKAHSERMKRLWAVQKRKGVVDG